MDLNKDNKDIYTIDSEDYSEYMQKNKKKPKDFLLSLIQFLVVMLLIVLVYFFFNILKNDLTFSEVFNKKELLATYESLMGSDEEVQVKVSVAEVATEKAEPIKQKPIEQKREVAEVIATKKNVAEEKNITKEKIVLLEEPKPVKIVKEVEEKQIVKKEVSEGTVLTESYLDRMVAELNSRE